jgi:hypothetical protein
LSFAAGAGRDSAMSDDDAPTARPTTREERLAAKLRENLRRRKAQARALDRGPGGNRALSKTPPKS